MRLTWLLRRVQSPAPSYSSELVVSNATTKGARQTVAQNAIKHEPVIVIDCVPCVGQRPARSIVNSWGAV